MEPATQTDRPIVTGIAPYLTSTDAKAAVEFYKKAFAAEVLQTMPTPDGRMMHAHLRINGGNLMLSDGFPEHGAPALPPQAFTLHLQVDDIDAWWNRATAAGAVITMPLQVQFWGDRYGQLRDPFGVMWSLGSPA